MLKTLAVGLAVALAGITMISDPGFAQPGWGPPGPPPLFGGPNFGIYIGPGPGMRPPPPPRGMYCDYRACAATYRSFDPRSCTYQPHYGPRRYCRVRW